MSRSSRLQAAIFSILPPALGEDIKDSVSAVIQSQFEQMNLVSRSEFEVQQKVLAKTRAKLEALEKILSELEKPQA
jgi:BMFP domain-containing protein YqiC